MPKKQTTAAKPKSNATAWEKLSHAYGKATDVPGLLEALGSSQAKARAQAIWKLGASICHQGTFYSATPPAIPVLVDLAAQPKTKDRQAILKLLGNIATFDDHARFLLDGIEEKRMPALPKVYSKSLEAVRAGFPVFAKLLDAREPEVRAAAAFLLAWLEGSARESLPLVKGALAREKNASTKAALCLSLAYLARYVQSKSEEAALKALLDDNDLAVRTAAAIALAHVRAGRVDEKTVSMLAEGAPAKNLAKTSLPWLDGDLAQFATRVLAALPKSTAATEDALLRVIEAGGSGASFAANVLVRRLPPFAVKKGKKAKKRGVLAKAKGASAYTRRDRREEAAVAETPVDLADVSPAQRRFLEATSAHPDTIDADLTRALEERGLPTAHERLLRFLGKTKAPDASLLDRVVHTRGAIDATVEEILVAAAKAKGLARAPHIARLTSALDPNELLDATIAAEIDLDGPNLWEVTHDLAWAAGPGATKALAAATAKLEKEGAPKRTTEHGETTFENVFVVVGIAHASAALAKKKTPAPLVDRYLQHAYGFIPRVRDALAALPVPRREKWVLNEERDDQVQPAEHFVGAWPYWLATPTTAIVARALEHVAEWQPKDPWGGSRKKLAVPHLVALIDAVRANGGDPSALEAALAKMRT